MDSSTFAALGLSPDVLKALEQLSYKTPSPIQAEAIPHLMQGKDLIGQAQTGTGKTAAFALPIIEKINVSQPDIQALVLCPTRELAMQVAEAVRKLAQFKPGLGVVSVYGGQSMEKQIKALKKRPQVLIATPGRLMDLQRRNLCHLKRVTTLVLDEADEMLNRGFRPDIETIIRSLPKTRQTIFFSATMPKAILELTYQYQQDPVHVTIAAAPEAEPNITQAYVEVSQKSKPHALTTLIQLFDMNLALVFCNTKRQVDHLAQHLQLEGFAAESIHGGKAQNQRERILNRFRKGETKILVATDVAARGIHVNNIEAVVNYDLPEDEANYTHRIGRTGRAGQSGQAFSLVTSREMGILQHLQKRQKYCILRQPLDGLPAVADFDDSVTHLAPASKRRKPFKSSTRSFKPRHRPGSSSKSNASSKPKKRAFAAPSS